MAKRSGGAGWSFRPAGGQPPREMRVVSLPASEQRPRVTVERRAKGKTVTVVGNLVLSSEDLKKLGQQLKAACGTGGTTHPGAVELQGDCRTRAEAWLDQHGWGRG